MDRTRLSDLHKNPVARHLVVGGVILLVILILFLFSDYGLVNRYKYEKQYDEMTDKVENEKDKRDSLLEVEKKLKSDTLEIERIAREKYGMVKEGEVIYFIEDKEDN